MKTIDEYKSEFMSTYLPAAANIKAQPAPEDEGKGYITVFVTHSRGNYPVKDAKVTITKTDGTEIAVKYTDESGETENVTLPVPKRSLSESPGTDISKAAGFFDIKIEADGFITAILKNVPVFDGIVSSQPYDMLFTDAAESTAPQITVFNNENIL